jgi:hypothetical protein
MNRLEQVLKQHKIPGCASQLLEILIDYQQVDNPRPVFKGSVAASLYRL